MKPMDFQAPLSYKLIYVFAIDDSYHFGMLKIGEASLSSSLKPEDIAFNCDLLNEAANARIKSYTNTAGIEYRLIHTELAVCIDKCGNYSGKTFRDHNVHAILENSGIKKVQLNGTTANEWYECTEQQAIHAIRAAREGRTSLTGIEKGTTYKPIVLRVEQEDAIKQTLERFKKSSAFLWNAKMRFGKTLSALTLIKRGKYRRTIIVTHRPVVGSGWYEDFEKVFSSDDHNQFVFKEKGTEESSSEAICDQKNESKLKNLDATGAYFIYFASIQDLRGSMLVGGKYDKNNAVYEMDWDLIITDEAHEGTQTSLGRDVAELLKKRHTKLLALSGTPFNIIDQYGDNVYTWDYINEQKSKEEWDTLHPGDSNPYSDLPQMHIYTYDIGNNIAGYMQTDLDGKAFNFREFFRVWTGDSNLDRKQLPSSVHIGDFIHKDDVTSFLSLITRSDEASFYPYATEEFRSMFKHTLWLVPGVKEARALSAMLKDHPIFSTFGIANVSGEGDVEESYDDALQKVRNTIAANEYSITLSCGKLTTGVTVKEWTAVLMLSGSSSTAAAGYMQTIFRVQSAGVIDGKQKEHCYVFDFAPDRTLKVLADVVERSAKRRQGIDGNTESVMGDFLNYCPVISISGTQMKSYSVNSMMGQLKRIFVERAIRSGFDDNSIYDRDRLLKLTQIDEEKFIHLRGIIGASKAMPGQKAVIVNAQGFDEEEHDKPASPSKPGKPQRDEEQWQREELKRRKEERAKAISILRGVSIRMPLLIYGADVPFDEDITIERFVEMVDDESWKEFMPQGVTKTILRGFLDYYDKSVFISAGREIRRLAKEADALLPSERVKSIAKIFSYFKNPDKETVLTPWRVVNVHMSDIMGGYSFWDDTYSEMIESPHALRNGKVTDDVLGNRNARVLEINSKSGLYPLYVAYSIFRAKLGGLGEEDLKEDAIRRLWDEALHDNMFIICKTPMARTITKRTLAGYKGTHVNAIYYKNLVNTLKEHPEQFVRSTTKRKTWGLEGSEKMEFDAVVGNPPYQVLDGGNKASAVPIYQEFIRQAKNINPRYLSMLVPARWYSGGRGLDSFRSEMLSDRHIRCLVDFTNSEDCFPGVDIAGGICYFLWDRDNAGTCKVTNIHNGASITTDRVLDEYDSFIRYSKALSIIEKVRAITQSYYIERVSSQKPFGLRTYVKPIEDGDIQLRYGGGTGKYHRKDISCAQEWIDKYKVIVSYLTYDHAGRPDKDGKRRVFSTIEILGPESVCTETYLVIDCFDTFEEAQHLLNYLKTFFVRFLVAQLSTTQHISKASFAFVPVQSFNQQWTDAELYEKYNLTEEEIAFIESLIKPM